MGSLRLRDALFRHRARGSERSSSIRFRIPLAYLVLALGAILPAAAQTVSASISGSVTDPAGIPVADALVIVQSQETAALRRAATGPDGRFEFNMLRPGQYTVRVEAVGFRAFVREHVALALQGAMVLDVVLSPALVEEVSVSGDAPVLDPSNTSGGISVGKREILALPSAGRVFTDLALLDASLRPVAPGTFYGERAAVFTGNGQGGRSNSFLVDGVDNNDLTVGASSNSGFSKEVIQEFRVLTDGFAPEFGRASGGVLNILTRSGGNETEGAVFVQLPSSMSDAGPFVTDLPPVPSDASTTERTQFGGHLSGPLRKDKAFYFVAYEQNDTDELVPFVGTQPDGTAGGRYLAPDRNRNAFFKLDWIPGTNHHFDVRLSWDDAEVYGVNVGGITTPEAGHSVGEDDRQLAASFTSVFGPSWFNEFRLLASRSRTEQRANSPLPGVDRPSGIFGGNHLQLQDRGEDRLQLVDNVSWFHGRHAVKFGIDLQRVAVDIGTGFNANGVFLYSTDRPFEPGDNGLGGIGVEAVDDDQDGTTDELPDFDTYPLVYQLISGNPKGQFRDTLLAFFVQDQWRVTDDLQVTYGLRYDLDTFELSDQYSIEPGPPNGGAKPDRNNVAPRIAFTWTPRERLLLRGGLGMFYDKMVLGFPAVSAITGQQTLGLAFVGPLRIPCDENLDQNNCRQVLHDLLVADPRFSLYFTTGHELSTPYTVQASLAGEFRVARSTVLSAGVVRARGYHLPLLRDLNPVDDFFLVDGDPERKFPLHRIQEQGSIASFETMGNSWYNALDVSLSRRDGPFRFRASYTLSRSEDEGSDPLRGGISLPPDSDNIRGERARSDNDQRHRFVLAGTWSTPLWDLVVSPVVTYSTGMPFSVTVSDDLNGDGLNNDRPCDVLDTTAPCTGTNVVSRLPRNSGEATPLSLVNDLRGAEGLPPVAGLSEPDFLQVDVRVSRLFHVKSLAVEGLLEVVNVFNRFNGGPVDGRISSRTFGEPIGLMGPPRQVQIGLRVSF